MKPELDDNKQKEAQLKGALSLGIVVGMMVGSGLGIAFENYPLGLALGMLVGAAIGAVLERKSGGGKV